MRQGRSGLDGSTACITTTVKTGCVVVPAATPSNPNSGGAWQ